MNGRVLIIAGSDSGGGAGVQADIKSVTALGGFAATAITALTAQNTVGVHDVFPVDVDFIQKQMRVVLDDIGADSLKTGMLHSSDVIEAVCAVIETEAAGIPLVVDPVMVAKGGASLLDTDSVTTLRDRLLPLARVITPNIPEAEEILGKPGTISTVADMKQAAEALKAMGPGAVLVKGGHMEGDALSDVLLDDAGFHVFETRRIDTTHTHGTGCTLASSIATGIAQGMGLPEAVARAQAYVVAAIKGAPGHGAGHGPIDHGHTVAPFKGRDAVELSIFQIDAFADRVFGGNPAAIFPLDSWVPDDVMQAIAAENNLAETAFFVAADSKDTDGACYDLRWFTPTLEVELCGHATLASAFLIFERFAPDAEILRFRTRSGELTVTRQEGQLFLDFPSYPGPVVDCPDALISGLGKMPHEVIEGPNYMAVFGSEADIATLEPDMEMLATLHPRGVIATAPGDAVDFVSRYFGPSFGVPEDPVTGSAHCMLTPYWATRLGKTRMDARQISTRGGALVCEDRGDRVGIGGQAVLYLEGKITV